MPSNLGGDLEFVQVDMNQGYQAALSHRTKSINLD